MLLAGMNIARLNYSHGDLASHQRCIGALRAAAAAVGVPLTILADLPGPKMRVLEIANEPVVLGRGAPFTLTTDAIVGDEARVAVNFPRLTHVVTPGAHIFLNDGTIQLEVVSVVGPDVMCRVLVGGELRSHKGLNLPGLALGVSAFTEHDHACLKSALENGVDAVSQSFVEGRADVDAVREAAAALGHRPFIIAKIERANALANIDEILLATDGIMIARGDLGVELPIEQIAVVQKRLTAKANFLGKPVVTATQMLESMMDHPRPTRAEATDVANAILDGSDCVMLSEESAMGRYPVEAVRMLASIAEATEPFRVHGRLREVFPDYERVHEVPLAQIFSHHVQQTVDHLVPSAVIVATDTGRSARLISRFKLPVWITAVSGNAATCRQLQFSFGVHAVYEPKRPSDWKEFARGWVREQGLPDGLVVLTESPSPDSPGTNYRIEVMDLRQPT